MTTAEMANASRLDRLVAMAREQLGMDVSYVSRFDNGQQVFSAIQGDGDSFGLTLTTAVPLDETYCQRMIAGELPSAIPDTGADERVRDWQVTTKARIGAYVGVPLHLPDGSLYGTFCCLSHEAQPALEHRDVRVLRMLSELLADDLAADAQRQRDRYEIEDLLADEALDIALQPVVELASGECHTVEALARFTAAPPDVIFASARNAGLGPELELLCLRRALTVLPHLRPEQRLSVNISPDVACAAASGWLSALPLERLVLEITEHAAVAAYGELREVLVPLRRRGLQIAVDDAGAGFASLRHILELAPDIIKIDRSLVTAVDAEPARRTIVTTFVLLALDLGATVIAEGVEREQELSTLSDLGVDAAQGYLLARPSTAVADLHAWTHAERPPWMPAGGWPGTRPRVRAASAQ